MTSRCSASDTNKNMVQIKLNNSIISKDILDLVIFDSDGHQFTIGELFDQVIKNKNMSEANFNMLNEKFNQLREDVYTTCDELKDEINRIKLAEDKTDELLVRTSDIMFKKVIRLEKQISKLGGNT